MARTDRFYIGMIDQGAGLDTSLRPYAIPDNAFQSLVNAYIFRGRLRKRFGSRLLNTSNADDFVNQLFSRVRIQIDTTSDIGGVTTTVPVSAPDTPITTATAGQLFSVGEEIFTVVDDSTVLSTSAATLTYDFTTGAVVVSGATASTPLYFYPALPIIGIVNYFDGQLNNEPFITFDQNYAYQWTGTDFQRLDGEAQPGSSVWTGQDYQVMWGYTYRGPVGSEYYVFVTNFNNPDYMRYYDTVNQVWNFLAPVLNGTYRLITSRIIVPFKDRLVCLNTVENNEGTNIQSTKSDGSTGNFMFTISSYVFKWGQTVICGTTTYTIRQTAPTTYAVDVISNAVGNNPPAITVTFTVSGSTGTFTSAGDTYNLNLPVYYLPNTGGTVSEYVNRCRYSQNGSPVSANAFEDSVAGLGGYIDAPTKEQIITSEFIKDRLIVYFESSTWELVYTGNEILPFRWQQINTELGAQSTFSIVPFDKVAIGIGNVGIHACNGTNVERIDDKIPENVFEISNENNGPVRVYGIRDYYTELIYWSIPTEDVNDVFPNRILTYNYKTGSWSYNDDSVTAFGYFYESADVTWNSTDLTWEEYDAPWFSPTADAQVQRVIAGNQEGFVFICDPDVTRNAPALQITNISISGQIVTVTCINHNLIPVASPEDEANGDYFIIENCQGITGLNGNIYAVSLWVDVNTFIFDLNDSDVVTGTYSGGGTIARVSNYSIITKQYNFYAKEGYNAAINKVDFMVDNTGSEDPNNPGSFLGGAVTVDYAVSSSRENILFNASQIGSLVGTGILTTYPYPTIFTPLEESQDRLWHPIYPMANGECIQLEIYMNDNENPLLSQIRNPQIAFADLVIHALVFYSTKSSNRFQ